MKGYGRAVFSQYAQELRAWAERVVEGLPEPAHTDVPEGSLLRCHEVARAFARLLELEVADGHYCAVEHSWLYVKKPWEKHAECILDVYAVGRLPMVQLVDLKACSLTHRGLYREGCDGKKRTDVREGDVKKILEHVTPADRLLLNQVRLNEGVMRGMTTRLRKMKVSSKHSRGNPLNLRYAPDLMAETIDVMPVGQTFFVEKISGRWAWGTNGKTLLAGALESKTKLIYGWAMFDYLEDA